jgi:hypothetical protein
MCLQWRGSNVPAVTWQQRIAALCEQKRMDGSWSSVRRDAREVCCSVKRNLAVQRSQSNSYAIQQYSRELIFYHEMRHVPSAVKSTLPLVPLIKLPHSPDLHGGSGGGGAPPTVTVNTPPALLQWCDAISGVTECGEG